MTLEIACCQSLQKNLSSLVYIARFNPKDRPVSSTSRRNGVECCYVNLGLGQFGFYLSDSTCPIISLDQETGFRPYQLYLCFFGGILENRLIRWNKIKLCPSTFRKPDERLQVDPPLLSER